MSKSPPRIVLIGAGRFGKNHLRVLKELERAGKAVLRGVVVRSRVSEQRLAADFGAPVFLKLTDELLSSADAAVVATPPATHAAIVRRCLRFVHVFAEKPLALCGRDAEALARAAKKNGKVLMVGHIYRFHPLLSLLRRHLPRSPHAIREVSGVFVSPENTDRGEDAVLEEMHLFDILDALYGAAPAAAWSREEGRITRADMRYAGGFDAHFEIGWDGARKERVLSFFLRDGRRVSADFARGALRIVSKDGKRTRELTSSGREPLAVEHECFLRALRDVRAKFPDGDTGARIVGIAERALPCRKTPRVAIIGGGIFGATAAFILSKHFPVTLFERHRELLSEASYVNQYRHHRGFHYPRSPETIRQIRAATRDFESLYGKIILKIPSYYAVARSGSKTDAAAFKKVCRANRLRCRAAYPPREFLNRETVLWCAKTNEAVYDFDGLREVVEKRIRARPRVSLRKNAEVRGIRLLTNGEKEVRFARRNVLARERFEYVVNTTYANYNTVLGWLGFPKRALEYRFKEIAVVRLPPRKPCAVTIVDGPFATLVATGIRNQYTLGDVPLSVHRKSRQFSDRLCTDWHREAIPRARSMLKRCVQWFPILERARLLKSLFVTLPIDIASVSDDARPTSLVSHGFGCFSVLEGKIITSVTVAKKLCATLLRFERTRA